MTQPIAYVLLQNPATPKPPALADALRQRHPEHGWQVDSDSANPNGSVVRCGRHTVSLKRIDAPMPQDDALWERARILWRDGRQAAARHRAHVTVSTADADLGELERARIATAVVGGLILSLPDTCAIIWRGIIGRSPQTWLQFSQKPFGPGYPFVLWIDILPFKSVESIGALTVGLSSFTGREIECDLPGIALPDLVGRVGMIASELIGRGDGIKDGEMIALSDTDRIKVHFAVSRFNGSPVLRVGSETPAGAFKHYPVISPASAKAHPLLVLLDSVGLFDVASATNQVQLQAARYDSEQRLDTYDQGVDGVLSAMQKTDAFVAAEKAARAALARGDTETAKTTLRPFAEQVKQLQAKLRSGLVQGRVFLFLPKQSTTKLS